jgi:uncharacterized protein YacL
MSSNITLRLFGMLLFALGGFLLGQYLAPLLCPNSFIELVLPLTIAGAIVGLLGIPYITVYPVRAMRHHLRTMPGHDLAAGVAGLFVGLLLGLLASWPLSNLPWGIGQFAPAVASLLFAAAGTYVGSLRRRDIADTLARLGQRAEQGAAAGGNRSPRIDSIVTTGPLRNDDIGGRPGPPTESYLLVDTSAIIDGRIADISRTGFLDGTLLVPRFVLNELQHIADSPDNLRRARGRRGLDILNRLQRESTVPVQISEVDAEEIPEVDGKLIKIARTYKCAILTTDFNLNRVAEIQGVRVLNLNELANAIKPVVLPGEEMNVHVIQEGKELGQGVAFLDDGTMVVVENGKRYMNSDVEVVVTRVLQTVAGRMIFAQMKNGKAGG